jgi:hypothetical protein
MKIITSTMLLVVSLNAFSDQLPVPSRDNVRRVLNNLNRDSFANPRAVTEQVNREVRAICDQDASCSMSLQNLASCFISRWTATPINGRPNPRFNLTVDQHYQQWTTNNEPIANRCRKLLDRDRTDPVTVEAALGARPAGGPGPRDPDSADSPRDPAQRDPATAQAVGAQLRNIKPETCKWVSELPRRIINAPGCSASTRNRICTGFVSCVQRAGGVRLVRLSTCRAEHCGNGDENAVRCTQDMGYSSSRPQGETRDTVSPDFRRSGSATAQ